MGENQIKIVRVNNEKVQIKNISDKKTRNVTEAKLLVAFSTLGCRVNHYETEAMAEKFIREGYEVTNFENFADVYVINTAFIRIFFIRHSNVCKRVATSISCTRNKMIINLQFCRTFYFESSL